MPSYSPLQKNTYIENLYISISIVFLNLYIPGTCLSSILVVEPIKKKFCFQSKQGSSKGSSYYIYSNYSLPWLPVEEKQQFTETDAIHRKKTTWFRHQRHMCFVNPEALWCRRTFFRRRIQVGQIHQKEKDTLIHRIEVLYHLSMVVELGTP